MDKRTNRLCARDSDSALNRRSLLGFAVPLAVAPVLSSHLWSPPAWAATTAGLKLEEIAPGVFVHVGRFETPGPENAGDISNASIVIGDHAVAVIDTLGSASVGKQLKVAVRQLTDRPIQYVINTHMHPDHVFGNTAFNEEGVEFIAHYRMDQALRARTETYMKRIKSLLGDAAFAGSEIVYPTKLVGDELILDLGGRKLVLTAHKKTAHTNNDLTVRDTKTDTLFFGDLLFSKHVPTIDGSIRGWISLLGDLETLKAQRVVPGHGPAQMPFPGALEPEKRYLEAIAAEVRKLIADGKTLEEAIELVGPGLEADWLLFDHYHARNVTTAFAELEWE